MSTRDNSSNWHENGDESGTSCQEPEGQNAADNLIENESGCLPRRAKVELNIIHRPAGSSLRDHPLIINDGPGESQTVIITVDEIDEETKGKSSPELARFLFAHEDEMKTDCRICLRNYIPGEEVVELGCSHIYHGPCIGTWVEKNQSCPLCRSRI